MQPNLRNGDRLAIIGVAVIILLFAVLMKGPELLALITQLIGDAS